MLGYLLAELRFPIHLEKLYKVLEISDGYFIPFEIELRVMDSRKRGNQRVLEFSKNILGFLTSVIYLRLPSFLV